MGPAYAETEVRFVCCAISMVGRTAVGCKGPLNGKLALYRAGKTQQSGRDGGYTAQVADA
jgi:hypothetical protein